MYGQRIISNITLLNIYANLNKGVCILCNASLLLWRMGILILYASVWRDFPGVGGSRLAHDLFLCSRWAKNGVYIFKWLKKNIIFCDMWNSHGIQMSVSINKVLLEHRHTHSFLCATTIEASSFNRDCVPSLKYLLSEPLQKKFAGA